MSENKIVSKSPEETAHLAAKLASEYSKALILLHGELGAGKTLFVSGFAKGLGITDYVSSPSYTLMNEYRSGDISVFHIDLYRLNCFEEVIDIGLFDVLESGMPCLVEWAERIEELDKLPHLDVFITRQKNSPEEAREICWQWKEPEK